MKSCVLNARVECTHLTCTSTFLEINKVHVGSAIMSKSNGKLLYTCTCIYIYEHVHTYIYEHVHVHS